MSIKDIQAKVHHNFNDTWNKDSTFQTAEGVIVQSALIFKKHGKSDKEIAEMLKKDFMLNEKQIQIVLDKLNDYTDITGKGA